MYRNPIKSLFHSFWNMVRTKFPENLRPIVLLELPAKEEVLKCQQNRWLDSTWMKCNVQQLKPKRVSMLVFVLSHVMLRFFYMRVWYQRSSAIRFLIRIEEQYHPRKLIWRSYNTKWNSSGFSVESPTNAVISNQSTDVWKRTWQKQRKERNLHFSSVPDDFDRSVIARLLKLNSSAKTEGIENSLRTVKAGERNKCKNVCFIWYFRYKLYFLAINSKIFPQPEIKYWNIFHLK